MGGREKLIKVCDLTLKEEQELGWWIKWVTSCKRRNTISKVTGTFRSRRLLGNSVLKWPSISGRTDKNGEISTGHEGTFCWWGSQLSFWRTRSKLICKKKKKKITLHQCGGGLKSPIKHGAWAVRWQLTADVSAGLIEGWIKGKGSLVRRGLIWNRIHRMYLSL